MKGPFWDFVQFYQTKIGHHPPDQTKHAFYVKLDNFEFLKKMIDLRWERKSEVEVVSLNSPMCVCSLYLSRRDKSLFQSISQIKPFNRTLNKRKFTKVKLSPDFPNFILIGLTKIKFFNETKKTRWKFLRSWIFNLSFWQANLLL